MLGMYELADWLASILALVKFAHVDGTYTSDSTLMILTIPVAVWDLLPNNSATSFIGFVRSHNQLEACPLATELIRAIGLKFNNPGAEKPPTARVSPSPIIPITCFSCQKRGIMVFDLYLLSNTTW